MPYIKPLNTGAFGAVYEGIEGDNVAKRVAIKIQGVDCGISESNMLMELSHYNYSNIIHYKDRFFDLKGKKMYIVMEYCSDGTLLKKIEEHISEKNAQKIFSQIVAGLENIHALDIIHSDLKPENILFRNKSIESLTMIDFGLSQKCKCGIVDDKRIGGTANYIAPEIYNKEGLTKKSDIWSMGVILYEMLFHITPFENIPFDIKKLVQKIITEKPQFPPNHKYSKDVENLIEGMLRKNKEIRLTLADIKKHKWLSGNSSGDLEDLKKEETVKFINHGSGICQTGWYRDANVSLHSCKNLCATNPECTYVSYYPKNHRCAQFKGLECILMTEFHDFTTYKVQNRGTNSNRLLEKSENNSQKEKDTCAANEEMNCYERSASNMNEIPLLKKTLETHNRTSNT
jgi:serine/threonine protein kinase